MSNDALNLKAGCKKSYGISSLFNDALKSIKDISSFIPPDEDTPIQLPFVVNSNSTRSQGEGLYMNVLAHLSQYQGVMQKPKDKSMSIRDSITQQESQFKKVEATQTQKFKTSDFSFKPIAEECRQTMRSKEEFIKHRQSVQFQNKSVLSKRESETSTKSCTEYTGDIPIKQSNKTFEQLLEEKLTTNRNDLPLRGQSSDNKKLVKREFLRRKSTTVKPGPVRRKHNRKNQEEKENKVKNTSSSLAHTLNRENRKDFDSVIHELNIKDTTESLNKVHCEFFFIPTISIKDKETSAPNNQVKEKLRELSEEIEMLKKDRKVVERQKWEYEKLLKKLQDDIEAFDAYKGRETSSIQQIKERAIQKANKNAQSISNKDVNSSLRKENIKLHEELKMREMKYKESVDTLRKQLEEAINNNKKLEVSITELRNSIIKIKPLNTHKESTVETTIELNEKEVTKQETSIKNAKNIDDTYDMVFLPKYHSGNEKMTSQQTYKDGKTIKQYANGKTELIFSNGVRKEIFPDSYSVIYFNNKDIKQLYNDGRIVYYFASTKTTQTLFSDGLQVFKFPTGQIEKHYPDGSKEITFPDGTLKSVLADGQEESVFVDGTIQRIEKNGLKSIEYPNGEKEIIFPDGTLMKEFPNGRIKKTYPDGSYESTTVD